MKEKVGKVWMALVARGTGMMFGQWMAVMLLTLVSWIAVPQQARAIDGSGDEATPYQIGSEQDWKDFVEMVNAERADGKFFQMTGDVTLTANSGNNTNIRAFLVGYSKPFKGTFDGGNHKLTLDFSSNYFNAAPFYSVDGATIKNLHLAGSVSSMAEEVSGLVGQVNSGGCTVENCRNSLIVSYVGTDVGSRMGGYFAHVDAGTVTITNSVFDGILEGKGSNYGGFVAKLAGNGALSISNSVFAPLLMGGMLGTGSNADFANLVGKDFTVFTDNYSTAYTLSEHVTQQGRPAYRVFTTGTVLFGNVTETVGPTTGVNEVSEVFYTNGVSTFELTGAGSYLAYNGTLNSPVDGVYTLTPNYQGDIIIMPSLLQGEGTQANPYKVGSYEDWVALVLMTALDDTNGKYYSMTNDITVEGNVMVGTPEHPFKGHFLGNGHTLTINYEATEDYCAPFRYTGAPMIQNLIVTGTIHVAAGKKWAAGLVASAGNGEANGGTIIDCISNVSIDTDNELDFDGYHGGFVGKVNGNTESGQYLHFQGCLFNGAISNTNTKCVGGFVGDNCVEANTAYSKVRFTNCLFATPNLSAEGNAFVYKYEYDDVNHKYNTDDCVFENCYFKGKEQDGTNEGMQAYEVTTKESDKIQLDFGILNNYYFVTGIKTYQDNRGMSSAVSFYAGEKEVVTFTDIAEDGNALQADFGTLVRNAATGVYTLTMPAGNNVEISRSATPITYNIEYNLDEGTVSAPNPATYTVNTETFTLNNPTKDGFDFVGWTGTDLVSATTTVTIEKGSKGNRSYKAVWKSSEYVYHEAVQPSLDNATGIYTTGTKAYYSRTVDAVTTYYKANDDGTRSEITIDSPEVLSEFDFDGSKVTKYHSLMPSIPGFSMSDYIVIPKAYKALGADDATATTLTKIGTDEYGDEGKFYDGSNDFIVMLLGGNEIERIGQYAFWGSRLQSFTGNTAHLTQIGRAAFSWSSLKSLDLQAKEMISVAMLAFNSNRDTVAVTCKHASRQTEGIHYSGTGYYNVTYTDYEVTVDNAHVTLVTGKSYYEAGETVTFSVYADDDYTVNSVHSVDADITEEGEHYTFTMPAKNVKIDVELSYSLILANDADNGEKINQAESFDDVDVTLDNRSFKKNDSWNTICLPFSLDLTEEGNPFYGAVARELDRSTCEGNDVKIYFKPATTTLKAGTPYIIKWHTEDSGETKYDTNGNYIINDQADWNAFATLVNNGSTNLCAMLYSDVTLDADATAIGTALSNFRGTFDGNNHTLTLNWNTDSHPAAPFAYIHSATIQNLKVGGTIKVKEHYTSSLVHVVFDGYYTPNTIRNCQSDVAFDLTGMSTAVCGAFVGKIRIVPSLWDPDPRVNIYHCSFDGSMNLIGESHGYVTITEGDPSFTSILLDGTLSTSISNPTFMDANVLKETKPATTDYVDFIGSFSPVHFDGEDQTVRYVGSNNGLYYPSKAMNVNSCRAYFQMKNLPAGVRVMMVLDDEESNAVSNVMNDSQADDSWYMLDGRQLDGKPTRAGVYVKGNKKVIVNK